MNKRSSTPKHSPSPWQVDPDPRPGKEWNNHIYAADGLAVCFMAHSDGKDDERDEANALLVAAAPELLEALQLLHDNLAEYQWINKLGGYDNHDMKMARAAIKKARGQ